MQSVKPIPSDNKLLCGVSTHFIVKYNDKTELKVLFMGNYINIDNEYFYEITNYNEIDNMLSELFFQNKI